MSLIRDCEELGPLDKTTGQHSNHRYLFREYFDLAINLFWRQGWLQLVDGYVRELRERLRRERGVPGSP